MRLDLASEAVERKPNVHRIYAAGIIVFLLESVEESGEEKGQVQELEVWDAWREVNTTISKGEKSILKVKVGVYCNGN